MKGIGWTVTKGADRLSWLDGRMLLLQQAGTSAWCCSCAKVHTVVACGWFIADLTPEIRWSG